VAVTVLMFKETLLRFLTIPRYLPLRTHGFPPVRLRSRFDGGSI